MTICPHCQTTAKHGEAISCCSRCRRLFTSGSAFERHQRDGGMTCRDPAEVGLVRRPIAQRGTDASGWGFPPMTPEQRESAPWRHA